MFNPPNTKDLDNWSKGIKFAIKVLSYIFLSSIFFSVLLFMLGICFGAATNPAISVLIGLLTFPLALLVTLVSGGCLKLSCLKLIYLLISFLFK